MKSIKKTNLNLFKTTEICECCKCKKFFDYPEVFIFFDNSDYGNPKIKYICGKCEAKNV